MTALAELIKNNIEIALQTDSREGGFGLCEHAITARYQKDDAYLCLSAWGIAGEFVSGELVDVMPTTQFDEFLRIDYAGIDGLPEQPKCLWLKDFESSTLAQNPDFKAVVVKMADALFNLASNAKLLSKHPREDHSYPF